MRSIVQISPDSYKCNIEDPFVGAPPKVLGGPHEGMETRVV